MQGGKPPRSRQEDADDQGQGQGRRRRRHRQADLPGQGQRRQGSEVEDRRRLAGRKSLQFRAGGGQVSLPLYRCTTRRSRPRPHDLRDAAGNGRLQDGPQGPHHQRPAGLAGRRPQGVVSLLAQSWCAIFTLRVQNVASHPLAWHHGRDGERDLDRPPPRRPQ